VADYKRARRRSQADVTANACVDPVLVVRLPPDKGPRRVDAERHHDVALVDEVGTVIAQRRITETIGGY
jgi:hypothetical protein